ncbi:MAG: hypothetical protein V3S24_15515, partial [Candidatus Tectomicrobia bacterium]
MSDRIVRASRLALRFVLFLFMGFLGFLLFTQPALVALQIDRMSGAEAALHGKPPPNAVLLRDAKLQ